MTQAWIVRSLRVEGYERIALDNDLVSVGWNATGDLTPYADQPAILVAVRAAYPFVEWASIESYTLQLFQFRSVMQRGDIILLLRRDTPDVAIGHIAGDYAYRNLNSSGTQHVRSIRWKRVDISRAAVEREIDGMSPLKMLHSVEETEAVDRLRRLAEGEEMASPPLAGARSVPDALGETAVFGMLQRNLNYARSLAAAGQHLAKLQVGAFEVSDVFRAAWVQGVAALDHWVRLEVRARMLKMAGEPGSAKPKGFSAFQISIGQVERILSSRASLAEVLDEQLGMTRGHLAYQHPDKIRDAFQLVSDVKELWNKVAAVLNEQASNVEPTTGSSVHSRLAAITQRRNKIAHEYDEDPGSPNSKRPIDGATVTQTIDWIEQIAAAILVVLDKDS